MGNNNSRGVSVRRINTKMVKEHQESMAESAIKILLFGTNPGKSFWFNNSFNLPQPLIGITFKSESINIGDKLPDIQTIIYDTSEDTPIDKTDDNLIDLIQTNIDGIIFTYNLYDIKSLRAIQKAIPSIVSNSLFSIKNVRFLLLGIQEQPSSIIKQNNICRDEAQQFASYCNLFHLQLDITSNNNISSNEPYIFILRRILKQKDVEEGDGQQNEHDDNQTDIDASYMDESKFTEYDEDTTFTQTTHIHNLHFHGAYHHPPLSGPDASPEPPHLDELLEDEEKEDVDDDDDDEDTLLLVKDLMGDFQR